MSRKTVLILLAVFSASIFDCQSSQAQRKKRGLLSQPTAEEKATPDTAGVPTSTPKPSDSLPPSATPKSPPSNPLDPSADLFEMATKNKAIKEAAQGTAGSGSNTKPTDGTSKKKESPPPEILTISSDGINIMAALFQSPNAEDPELAKVIAPVMLLHDWGGTMNDLGPLAQYLQSVGHTVIVPDLRGHGRSVTIANSQVPLDHTKFNKAQIASIKRDFEECKKRLIDFNNDGKLNISMLSVLAVGDMCPLATEWTLTDWSFQNVGGLKQGQDVQSLILVSPPKKFQQSSMAQLVRHPLLSGGRGVEIPTLVIYGQNAKAAKDAQALYRLMKRKRPASEAANAEQRWAEQSLFELPIPSSAEGVELLRPNPALFRFIGMFNFYKISRNADQLPWASREASQN
jgi:hypothetical protein